MFPIIFIAPLIIALLAGSTIALNWDKIIIALKGKNIAILGAREVGKTHLLKFLTTGSIPTEYKQTVRPEKISAKRFKLSDLNLNIKESLDVSGDTVAHAQWRELHDNADFVFYLIRADRIMIGDESAESRIRNDMRHISDWRKECKNPPQIFIIGTHCDLDPKYASITPQTAGNYFDEFQKLPIMSEILLRAGGTRNVKLTLGSMKTITDTEALVYQTLSQIES